MKGIASMFIGIITFIISWSAFLLFANKKKFPLFVLTGYVCIIFAMITDLMMFVYPLWHYPGTKTELFYTQLLNGFGLYFVVGYFFLQSIPKTQTVLSVIRHIFYWSIFVIILELFYIYVGFIKYGLWWNIGFSYIADWILFVIFYTHHKWISVYLNGVEDE